MLVRVLMAILSTGSVVFYGRHAITSPLLIYFSCTAVAVSLKAPLLLLHLQPRIGTAPIASTMVRCITSLILAMVFCCYSLTLYTAHALKYLHGEVAGEE